MVKDRGAARKKGQRFTVFLVPVVLALAAALLLFSDSLFAVRQQELGFLMDAPVMVSVRGKRRTARLALDAVAELEGELSRFREGTDVWKVNAHPGEAVEVSSRCIRLVTLADGLRERTGGAYSVTLGDLSDLWNITASNPAVPEAAEIDRLLKLPRSVRADGNTLMVTPAKALDLGSLGKGAACDAIRELLPERGAKEGVASVGGNVLVFGERANFKVAVRDPRGGVEDILGILTMGAGCVSTSGGYERYFELDGNRWHHILDGLSGYPAEPGLLSVTVIVPERADAGAYSDMLSTACFVLGYEASLPLLREYGVSAVFVLEDGSVKAVPGVGIEWQVMNP